MNEAWPYNLPIFRRAYRLTSPDGKIVAEIVQAFELGMSNPTCGTLKLSTGLQIDRCNPSFIWSEDSRYLAVPRYFTRLGLFRRQRMLVIDTVERKAAAVRFIASGRRVSRFSRPGRASAAGDAQAGGAESASGLLPGHSPPGRSALAAKLVSPATLR